MCLPLITDSWVSVDIPLTDFVPPVNLSEVFQFKVEGNGDIFFDNLYFWKTGSPGIAVDLKVFLEGPFSGSSMSTNLNPSQLPLSQPYDTAPWNYSGTESVASIPNSDIVDWVLVEYRDAATPETATIGATIGKQAAFVLSNGDVVSLDGITLLPFNETLNESLFVVIWHRNHLNVLSSTGLVEMGAVYSYDFTTAQGQAFENKQKEVTTGVWGMVGGNGIPDNQIDDLDKNSVWDVEAGMEGYLQGDFNLDGQVNNLDKNQIWTLNSE